MGLPCWLLGLTLGPVIPAGLAQVPESLVSVYLGLGLDAVLVLVPKTSGCISGTMKNKSTQEKRPCSSCSETGEMRGMCEHLAEALDLDRGPEKGRDTDWIARQVRQVALQACSAAHRIGPRQLC